MSEVDDALLLEQARRGDQEALSALFARHQRAIYGYASYMCGPDAGDDLLQETFLAVLRQSGRREALQGLGDRVPARHRAALRDEAADGPAEGGAGGRDRR